MAENYQNRKPNEEIFCPVFKHKIHPVRNFGMTGRVNGISNGVHCSQIEGTEASGLSEERRYEFCLNKCPVHKRHKGTVSNDGKNRDYISK